MDPDDDPDDNRTTPATLANEMLSAAEYFREPRPQWSPNKSENQRRMSSALRSLAATLSLSDDDDSNVDSDDDDDEGDAMEVED